MHFDDDLVALMTHLSTGHMTESDALQTILKLVLELQQARRFNKVTKKLEPQAFNQIASTNPPSVAEKWFNQHDVRMGTGEKQGS